MSKNLFYIQYLLFVNVFSHDEDFNGPSYQMPDAFKPPVIKGDVYYSEYFVSKEKAFSKWIISQANKEHKNDIISHYDGVWNVEESKFAKLSGDLGLVLKSKAKHHAIATKLWKSFYFNKNPLIVQYDVKFQNGLDCGGAYIKLLMHDKELNLTTFHDCTPYVIMFGPDKCGNDAKIHFIFKHKNPITGLFEEKRSRKINPSEIIHFFTDKRTHAYRLAIYPNNSYYISVDEINVFTGSLLTDIDPPINPPKLIVDVLDKKPIDWDDRERIPDPNAIAPPDWDDRYHEYVVDTTIEKPDDWFDEEPEFIEDLTAVKPLDWDESIDGIWEPPMIINPICRKAVGCGDWQPPLIKNLNYKGPWKPPIVLNPNFKGPWKANMIPNPEYFEDKNPFLMSPIGAIGLELWSMSADLIFDNFLITSELATAKDWFNQTWKKKNIEEAKYIVSSLSLVEAIVEAANEQPLLWVAIIFGISMVTLVFLVCCCASPKNKLKEKNDDDDKDTGCKKPASETKTSKNASNVLQYNLLYNEKTIKGQRRR